MSSPEKRARYAVCRKDERGYTWPCSCTTCARGAAAAWTGLMDRVMDGSISLAEANTLGDADPRIASRSGE